MEIAYMELARLIVQDADYRCPVCGSPRYITNRIDDEIIIHCSSSHAKFWECPKDTLAETIARNHWDQSKQKLYLSVETVRQLVATNSLFSSHPAHNAPPAP